MRADRIALAAAALVFWFAAAPPSRAAEPAVEETFIPLVVDGMTYRLAATVLRPPGAARLPAIVLSHGAWGPAARRREQPRLRMDPESDWLAMQGYVVVVPMRRGYGASEGELVESSGPCDDADYVRSGLASAEDILAAVAWTRARPDVDPARIVLVGYSAGGWGTLGAASRAPAGVVAAINAAGGRGAFRQDGFPCRPDRMLEAATRFARTARLPTLWLYAQNDALFGPYFTPQLVAAWRAGGGDAEFHLLPPVVADGHGLFTSVEGLPYWTPFVADFLGRVAGR
jgi:dienelactone hydrolase